MASGSGSPPSVLAAAVGRTRSPGRQDPECAGLTSPRPNPRVPALRSLAQCRARASLPAPRVPSASEQVTRAASHAHVFPPEIARPQGAVASYLRAGRGGPARPGTDWAGETRLPPPRGAGAAGGLGSFSRAAAGGAALAAAAGVSGLRGRCAGPSGPAGKPAARAANSWARRAGDRRRLPAPLPPPSPPSPPYPICQSTGFPETGF